MNLSRKEIIELIHNELNKSNHDILDTYLDFDKFQCYLPNRHMLAQSKSVGSVEWKQMMIFGKISIPDLIYTVEDLIDDNHSKIVVRGRKKGIHSGSTPFLDASNEEIDISFISIFEFDDKSKIINCWALEDELTTWIKMGLAKIEMKSKLKDEVNSGVFGPMGGFPKNKQEITKEFLSTVFKTPVKSFVVQNDIGETQQGYAGETVRLSLEYETPSHDLPKKLIAKFASPNEITKNSLNVIKMFHREVFFYKFIAPHANIETAHCYYSEIDDPSGDHCILLEDLSEKGMDAGDVVLGASVERAKLVIEYLAKYHAQFWDEFLPNTEWLSQNNFMTAFRDMSIQMYGFSKPIFLKHFAERASPKFLEFVDKVDVASFYDDCIKQDKNLTFCHIDSHLNNMIFSKDTNKNDLVLIDWQLSMKGSGVRDIAQFISMNLQVEYFEKHLEELKQLYFDTLKKHCKEGSSLSQYTKEMFENDWRMALRLSFVSAVSFSIRTVQKSKDNDPKIQRIFSFCNAIQERTIKLIETEGVEKIFS